MTIKSTSSRTPQRRLKCLVELHQAVNRHREQSIEQPGSEEANRLDSHLDWLITEIQELVEIVQPPTVDGHLWNAAQLLVRQHLSASEDPVQPAEQDTPDSNSAADDGKPFPSINEYAGVDVRLGVPPGMRRLKNLPMPAPALRVAGVFFAPAFVRLHHSRSGNIVAHFQGWVVEDHWGIKVGTRIHQVEEAEREFLRQESLRPQNKVNSIVSFWRRNDARYCKEACLGRSTYGRLLLELERLQQAMDDLDNATRDEFHPLYDRSRSSNPPNNTRQLLRLIAWLTFPAAFPSHWGLDNPFHRRASAIRKACSLASKANVPFGWYLHRDAEGEVPYNDPWVVCFELRRAGKVTYRFPHRGTGPDYSEPGDQQPELSRQRLKDAMDRIVAYSIF